MATKQLSDMIHHLRRMVLLRDGADLTDAQLLTDYISRRDEAALPALVRRHGPMVWGVCRRILGNYHDAEDAFQATFLVFVRKATSIASRELLANWLYGVAHQTAMKARSMVARRKQRERQVPTMPERALAEPELSPGLQVLLDEELSHLPDKYRAVIVLYDLEGKTRKEVARQLGWPEGTVAGRLARARVMLARRLARRGVALPGGALAAVLAENVASAGVPGSFMSSTIQAASLFAAGPTATGLISGQVAALTRGVLKTMLMTKLRMATAATAIIAAVGFGGSSSFLWSKAPAQDANKPAAKDSAPERTSNDAGTKVASEDYEEFVGVVIGVLDESRFGVRFDEKRLGRRFSGEERAHDTAVGDIAVNKDTKFLIDGRQGKLADLQKYMRTVVELKPATNLALQVRASWPKVRGEIAFVDDKKVTLTTRKTHILPTENQEHYGLEVAYPDKEGVKVVIDGKAAKLTDLKNGMPAVLYLRADTEDIVRIEAKKSGNK